MSADPLRHGLVRLSVPGAVMLVGCWWASSAFWAAGYGVPPPLETAVRIAEGALLAGVAITMWFEPERLWFARPEHLRDRRLGERMHRRYRQWLTLSLLLSVLALTAAVAMLSTQLVAGTALGVAVHAVALAITSGIAWFAVDVNSAGLTDPQAAGHLDWIVRKLPARRRERAATPSFESRP